MTECNGSSSYEPSAIAQAFHNIPRADIDLNEAPDQFSLELSYYEAIIIWICAPVILCICIFILLSVYYICICCCCCCRQKKKRTKAAKRTCACFVSILIGLCLGIIGASLYAEVELDRNIVQAIDNGENINDTLTQVVDQVSTYPASNVTAALNDIENVVSTSQQDLQAELEVITQANQDIDEAFTSVLQILTNNDTSFFYAEAVTAVSLYETVRHWSIIGYFCLVAILLIVIFVTVVCFSPAGIVVFLVFLCIFTFTVWVAVGGALGLGIILGDVCSDPDAIVRNLSSSDPEALNVTNYYLSCQCDPFAKYKDQVDSALIEVMNVEQEILVALNNISDTNVRQEALEQFNIVTAILNDTQDSINNVTELLLCQPDDGINAYYDDALFNLCTQGFEFAVVQFSLLAGLAVMMVVLICCSTFFSGLLVSSRRGEDYDQRDIVAFDTEHSVSWANRRSSYSEPYISNGSTFHPPKDSYNTGHGSGLVSVAPPNYTDLHAARTSGRFSGEYDHFDA